MSECIYNAEISGFKFQMINENLIEVWSSMDDDFPFSQIYIESGGVKTRKDFDYEISDWYMKHN